MYRVFWITKPDGLLAQETITYREMQRLRKENYQEDPYDNGSQRDQYGKKKDRLCV